MECKRLRLIPQGFITKSSISTHNAEALEKRFARSRMMEELRHAHIKLLDISTEIEQLRMEFALDMVDIEYLQQVQFYCYQRELANKQRKISKQKQQAMKVKLDSVLNLSDHSLTEEELLYVLALGFNFQPRLTQLLIKDIIASTEVLVSKIQDNDVAIKL